MMKKVLSSIGLFLIPSVSFAHVGYVVSEKERLSSLGTDFNFFVEGFTRTPKQALIATGVVLILILLFAFMRRITWVRKMLFRMRARLATYYELLPWMARLSLGIAFIGAGTAEVLISPLLSTGSTIALMQILLGFFFLLGFLLTPAYLGAIALYIYALSQDFYLIGNIDVFALLLALIIFASGRPGLDDIFGIQRPRSKHTVRKLVPVILRVGLGVGFIFLALYEKILNPHSSELVVEAYNLTSVVPVSAALWVFGAGIIELLLGILLIIGFEVRLVSAISFFVISLSFFYFKEDVYSHVTLFGALSMVMVLGSGPYSIDKVLRGREY